jgi:hypothetical protein
MKKIITYLNIIIAGGLLAASCNLNETPEFSNSEAFVSFDQTVISVAEDTSVASVTLRVPVRLTSLGGLTSTVTYEIFESPSPAPGAVDKGAREGRDYELLNGSTVLTFTAENPVQYIEFDILTHAGEFTGDRSFGIKLTGSGSVNFGAADSTAITILDYDHPLAFILGQFKANGTSYFDGASEWTVTLTKDSADVTKVWITNFVAGGSSAASPVYGIVNDEKTEIRIPVGQEIAITSSYDVYLEGFYGPDGEDGIPSGGYITGLIAPNGNISIQDEIGSHAYYKTNGSSAGWYNIFSADVVLTKQ